MTQSPPLNLEFALPHARAVAATFQHRTRSELLEACGILVESLEAEDVLSALILAARIRQLEGGAPIWLDVPDGFDLSPEDRAALAGADRPTIPPPAASVPLSGASARPSQGRLLAFGFVLGVAWSVAGFAAWFLLKGVL